MPQISNRRYKKNLWIVRFRLQIQQKKELAEIVKYISVDLGEKKLQVNQILKQWHSF